MNRGGSAAQGVAVVLEQMLKEEAGSTEEALEFTCDMEKHRVEPDVATYNILNKEFRVLSDGWRWGQLNPDVVAYRILLGGHC
ncbi:hypothetical protein PTKIN_Ptkin02bG0029100 [Pterospermum kingtungense]